jgi:hypothetical protein
VHERYNAASWDLRCMPTGLRSIHGRLQLTRAWVLDAIRSRDAQRFEAVFTTTNTFTVCRAVVEQQQPWLNDNLSTRVQVAPVHIRATITRQTPC